MRDCESIQSELMRILTDRMCLTVPSLDSDLFAAEILDSLSLVNLLVQIEERFGIEVTLDNLDLETFSSVKSIGRFIASFDAGAQAGSAGLGIETVLRQAE